MDEVDIIKRFEADKPLKVGMYAMHHMCGSDKGTLVRVDCEGEKTPGYFGVRYVQVCKEGRVMGGGGSGNWAASDFKPITNPLLIAAAEAFECQLRIDEANYTAKKMERERDVRLAAVRLLMACGFKEGC